MMTLAERIHLRMISARDVRRRLDAVPPAVVEDVLRLGLEALVDMVPMGTLAANLTEVDFEACEVCRHLIDPDEHEGAVVDSEGIWLCDACAVENAPPSPSPGTTAAEGSGR